MAFRKLHREYNRRTKEIRKDEGVKGSLQRTVKEASQAMTFGMMLLSSFFLTFVAGYFVGTRYLGSSQTVALVLSAVLGVALLLIETLVYIAKMERTQVKLKKN